MTLRVLKVHSTFGFRIIMSLLIRFSRDGQTLLAFDFISKDC